MGVRTINSREARKAWRELLDSVFADRTDVVIERHGKAVAVMIPVDDYESIQDELDDLRSTRRVHDLYESWLRESTVARPIDDIEAELIAEGKLDAQG